MERMKCDQCGYLSKEESAKFCSQCGNRLTQVVTQSVSLTAPVRGKMESEPPESATLPDVDSVNQEETTDYSMDTTDESGETSWDPTNESGDPSRDPTNESGDLSRDLTNESGDTSWDLTNESGDTSQDPTNESGDTSRDLTNESGDTSRDPTNEIRDASLDSTNESGETSMDSTNESGLNSPEPTNESEESSLDPTNGSKDVSMDTTIESGEASLDPELSDVEIESNTNTAPATVLQKENNASESKKANKKKKKKRKKQKNNPAGQIKAPPSSSKSPKQIRLDSDQKEGEVENHSAITNQTNQGEGRHPEPQSSPTKSSDASEHQDVNSASKGQRVGSTLGEEQNGSPTKTTESSDPSPCSSIDHRGAEKDPSLSKAVSEKTHPITSAGSGHSVEGDLTHKKDSGRNGGQETDQAERAGEPQLSLTDGGSKRSHLGDGDSGSLVKAKSDQQSDRKIEKDTLNRQEASSQTKKGKEKPKNHTKPSATINEGGKSDQKDRETTELSRKRNINKNKSPAYQGSDLKPEERVTVYFHAILSKDFKFDVEKHRVVLRSGQLTGGNWTADVLVMNVSQDLGEHGYLIQGQQYFRKEFLNKSIAYKYAVLRDKEVEYETIYKHDATEGVHVNRYLCIQSKFLNQSEWHQYDDIVCAPPAEGWKTYYTKAKNYIRNKWEGKKDVANGKNLAGRFMLESLFDILSTWNKINLRSFFFQFHQFLLVYSNPMVFENDPKSWKDLPFGEKEVKDLILTLLRDKAKLLLAKDDQNSEAGKDSVERRLRMGMLILYLTYRYSINMTKKDIHAVCQLLSLQQMSSKVSEMEVQIFKETPLNERFSEALLLMIQKCIEDRSFQWVQVIPVFHIFCSSSKPTLSFTGHSQDVWAGLEGIAYVNCREKYEYESLWQLFEIMRKNKHLVDFDGFLHRSWFSLIPMNSLFEYVNTVTPDPLVVLQGLIYRLKEKLHLDQTTVFENLLQYVKDNLHRVLPGDHTEACKVAALKVHELICCGLVRFKMNCGMLTASVEIISELVGSDNSLSGQVADKKPESDEVAAVPSGERVLHIVLKNTRSWMKKLGSQLLKSYAAYVDKDELQIWSRLIDLTFGDERLTSIWTTELLKDLEGKIKQEKHLRQIEVYCKCHTEINEHNPLVAKCFEDCALDAVHPVCQDKAEAQLFLSLGQCDLKKFGKLLSTIIEKAWQKDGSGQFVKGYDDVIRHLLDWSAAKNIFKLQGSDKKLIDELTDEAKELMALADSVFLDVVNKLQQGSIQIKHLKWIIEKKQNFNTLHDIKKQSGSCQMKYNQAVLSIRENELKGFNERKDGVDSLLKMCRKITEFVKVDTEELEERLKADFGSTELKQVMNVTAMSNQSIPQTRPACKAVTWFHLSEQTAEMARNIHQFKDSHVFQMCWEKAAKDLSAKAPADIEFSDEQEGEEELYVESSMAPSVTLDQLNARLWEPCFTHYQSIYQKVKEGSLTFREVDEQFRDYGESYEDLKRDFEIMCKLSPRDGQWVGKRIQQIQEYHQLHSAVKCAEIIMRAKDILSLKGNFSVLETLLNMRDESFKEKKLNCISDELIEARSLLVNISEPCRKCLEELIQRQQFVHWIKDALGDINELKVFVDLASISAGENDLDVDRVACFHDAVLGYSSLLYELKPEFGFVDFMPCLQKLWKALKNDHNLSKKLRDSARHLDWLKTVKESHGSVELSSLSLASAINSDGIYIIGSEEQHKLSLGSAIKLHLPEVLEDSEELRCYTLEELKELQNKLMLMSGKGDHGQEEVERFAEVFANVQRLASSFISLCSAGNMLFRRWKAEVYCSTDSPVCVNMDFSVRGVGAVLANGNVTEQLPVLCRKMEAFLDVWKQFMDQQRSHCYYLNFYTAEQIVYLCTELFQRNSSSRLQENVLMMLSFVKPDCTAEDIRQAWTIWNTVQGPETLLGTRLKPFGGRKVEKRASMQLRVQEIAEARTVELKLDLLWKYYMENMTYFLSGCLDVGTLGGLLNILGDAQKTSIERALPPGLLEGRPNLVVCPRSELLTCALCVYMHTLHQPLPTYDEVLLCTAETGLEQIEIFLRRCLTKGCRGSKIYSLLFADALTYDVSVRFEELFKNLQLQGRPDYQLVIVCDSDQDHCYIPSAFSQYKSHAVPHDSLENIKLYLEKQYKVPPNVLSAASVFNDQMFVRIVSSKRGGVGKSLYVKRLHETLKKENRSKSCLKTIRLIEPQVDENKVLKTVLSLLQTSRPLGPTIFHFDITSSVQKGLSAFLFKLLILQYLMDTDGKMWKCQPCHLYIIELVEAPQSPSMHRMRLGNRVPKYSFLDVFPMVCCRPPKEVLELEVGISEGKAVNGVDPLMDEKEFRSEAFQRPYQYLRRFRQQQNLDTFSYLADSVEGSHVEWIQLFLIYCGVADPSWSELHNFAWFLNLQLRDCETSVFCDFTFIEDTLQGFKQFVVSFMILMAKDFATPSLSISDQSPGRQMVSLEGMSEKDIAPFLIRKKWECEPHPYIFFNSDHTSMTFIGFHLQENGRGSVDAVNPANRQVIKEDVMSRQLYQGLLLQRVPFNLDFDKLERGEKIERLTMVLGIEWPLDPDDTYELTTDNILKILAIHMRFRCGIPVIIMGETGCGKTRLIRFLCELGKAGAPTDNMKLVKVHGGTTADNIRSKIREAEAKAVSNKQEYGFDTVLFFDEANTTEAISCIKEVLCDQTIDGVPLARDTGLRIIAACNPYRKHTAEMIERLESAGLGYRVRAGETEDKLGSIPLRQLVYRVQALPPSMIPLVWDFGQLNDATEKIYIQQIVQRLTLSHSVPAPSVPRVVQVLSASQGFMRQRQDECSFVSLRDVERCMRVFVWFYTHRQMLLERLREFHEAIERVYDGPRDEAMWALVLAVGVCYHACLERKNEYRRLISRHLPSPYDQPSKILEQITLVQDLLLSGVPPRDTIAKNAALKENVFMMVICIELKIPLFLVGKPGSSKSLAKTIVADAMQRQAAHSKLYRDLKQIHLVSFQCSPHSTPEGIINTFRQCARFQESKNLEEYVSVVVLDEIGLAEDSPKMPLKTLHPLLEDGCIDDDPLKHKKVGFVGISNWALDPAKMNRGIFVSRGVPDKSELIETAKGICASNPMVLRKVQAIFQSLAEAYLNICKEQTKEFFGLRDYYSLIKMVFALSKASNSEPTEPEMTHVVLRNFSGSDEVNPREAFKTVLGDEPPDCINALTLVRQNIYSESQDGECRYLLVLTKNYVALQILQQMFFNDNLQPEIIFGSSFPKDQEYTQICRNINRVKICMETGQTVVLLNLQNLYESLYDALNQYYVYLGGQKYVDLGLGTHRVKCRVHRNFKLIVIEEKEVVHKEFPIPLINRLEKHYLDINTVIDGGQKHLVKCLSRWVEDFATPRSNQPWMQGNQQKYKLSDVFIGYHSDHTCASVVLQVTERWKQSSASHRQILEDAQKVLLNCATPDSVVRLSQSRLDTTLVATLTHEYFTNQHHDSLADFVLSHSKAENKFQAAFTEVTTYSRLLTASDVEFMQKELSGHIQSIFSLSLQQFDTEHSFLKKIRHSVASSQGNKILLIQTDFGNGSQSSNLIASAKYSTINEVNKSKREGGTVYVYFITKLPRMEGGSTYIGFHGDPWQSVHIDDLRKSRDMVADVSALKDVAISRLFEVDPEEPEAMIIDDDTENSEQTVIQPPIDKERVLETTPVIRSCVQAAVSLLRDQHKSYDRSTKRVEMLLLLLEEGDGLKASFLGMMKQRLYSLLLKRDEGSQNPNEWMVREASNLEALQEGGTFRHTLWKKVQAVITPFLAQIISVVDRDCNLRLLVDPDTPEFVRKLWMDIFNDSNLLDIPYNRNLISTQSEIVVPNYMKMDRPEACNLLPFSWRIKDYLDELLVQARYMEGETEQKLNEIFNNAGFGKYLSDLSEGVKCKCFLMYLHDFVLMTVSVSCAAEFEFLQGALLSCINEIKTQKCALDDLSLVWVHVAYQRFKRRLQNFLRMIAVNPKVLELLQGQKGQIDRAGENEMVLDVYAAAACVEMLEPLATEFRSDASCEAWLQKVKSLQTPIELICADESLSGQEARTPPINHIRAGWSRLFSLSLYVEHVVLGVGEVDQQLQDLVGRCAHQLGKCLQGNSDMKSLAPFKAVVQTLKQCKEQASQVYCKYGLKECPICIRELIDPVLLPCNHIYCLQCIKCWLAPGQMNCPFCLTDLPADFKVVVCDVIREAVRKNSLFRKRCDAFFISLVSMVCFRDNSPPAKDVILQLLSRLVIKKELLTRGSLTDQPYHTGALSPFDESVDRNPVIRSIVLKLLLKYSFDDIKDYLQQYLTAIQTLKLFSKEDQTELYILYLNCLGDSIYEKSHFCTVQEMITHLNLEMDFLQVCLRHESKPRDQTSIGYLQMMARIRLCFDLAAKLLCESQETFGGVLAYVKTKGIYLDCIKRMCTRRGNAWFQIYLVRKLCSLMGIESVQQLSEDQEHQWLFPAEIIQQQRDAPGQIDRYLVCGENYRCYRDALARALLECKTQSLTEAQKQCDRPANEQAVYITLAVFREITVLYSSTNQDLHPKPAQCNAIQEYIREDKVPGSAELKTFLVGLTENLNLVLKVNPHQSTLHRTIQEIIVHATAVYLSGQSVTVATLRSLVLNPANMVHAFLPTMPEDLTDEARRWEGLIGVHWYDCPNGHPCVVGECGMPMSQGRCIECQAEIGGANHLPVGGFKHARGGDRTQSGHILGDPNKRETVIAPDRNMSPVSFTLLRLLTHMAMFVGAMYNDQAVAQLIKPQVPQAMPFLGLHIERDFQQLMKSLGKSIDETANVVHLLLCNLIQQNQFPGVPNNLASKQERNAWEKSVVDNAITPTLANLDQQLREVNLRISQDKRICSNPMVKIVYGDPLTFLPLPRDNVLHCSAVWSCRERISIEHLAHIVQQEGKDTVPILCRFLQKEPQLRLVKFLPELLALQGDLVKRFQNVTEVTMSTISAFLQTLSPESVKHTFESRVASFLYVWNQLRTFLVTNGEIKIPESYCAEDINANSTLDVLLPRRQGLGLCSTALISYLVALQNDFVYTVEKYTNKTTPYSVNASDVVDLHVIKYEVERDLIPLISSNCQYTMEKGGETVLEYDLRRIEQQLTNRFLKGKPLVNLMGIPTLICRQDRNYENIFKDLKNKLPQELLPNSVINTISAELQSYSDICEAFTAVELTLGFLAMSGEKPDLLLVDYLRKVLHMGDHTAPHVMEALMRCSLKHIQALWQLLSARKSEYLLRLKREPFSGVGDDYRKSLSEEEKKSLQAFFGQSSVDVFILELHEMLILKCRNVQASDALNPTWSLKDSLNSFMEQKDVENLPELDECFPDRVDLSKAVATWETAVLFKRERLSLHDNFERFEAKKKQQQRPVRE
ncbi:E3 ubiquitin-protein ligase rnf213-alpha isoform X2 [Callorhinchus milii]|nr:E3 ubiquitin-protein ligase rnf213-alpha isoform X2 [Callorhinchus milii]XP_042198226.1 E3 ubiquitin-protein ligase rnf213-alpha isoform X2 [Callorhinchus milii]XP_042198227.1 E3 ubiquitin-protein ligase rnf213-alpha isoform X2 [Callorhinchus milii]